jgi:hypothetical protein
MTSKDVRDHKTKVDIIKKNYTHGSKYIITYSAPIFTNDEALQHRPSEKTHHHLHGKVPTMFPMTLDDVLYDIEYMLNIKNPSSHIGQISHETHKVVKFSDIAKNFGKYELTIHNSPIIITIVHQESLLEKEMRKAAIEKNKINLGDLKGAGFM